MRSIAGLEVRATLSASERGSRRSEPATESMVTAALEGIIPSRAWQRASAVSTRRAASIQAWSSTMLTSTPAQPGDSMPESVLRIRFLSGGFPQVDRLLRPHDNRSIDEGAVGQHRRPRAGAEVVAAHRLE